MKNLVFFGHHKCASTWMGKIFYGIQRLSGYTIKYGVDANSKLNVIGNSNAEMLKEYDDYLGVHLIRDPRDIVVSGYFSHKKTHPVNKWPAMAELRVKLNEVDFEKGLFHEMDFLEPIFNDMNTWDYKNPKVIELKFEEITTNPNFKEIFEFLEVSSGGAGNGGYAILKTINKISNKGLLPFANSTVTIPFSKLEEVVEENSFKKLSGGRKKGTTNSDSHYRKGTSGEWQSSFTEEHKAYFKKKFPNLLQNLGYATDSNW